MLRCVFVGRNNGFNRFLADWLAERTDLRAIIWADEDRSSRGWILRWIRRSLKRNGLWSTLDRILFRVWCILNPEISKGWEKMVEDIRAAEPVEGLSRDARRISAGSINTPEIEAVLKEAQPDIVIVNCISQLIKKRILRIPTKGTYIYHEALTPEYRGMHTPFWALARGDDHKVGYTLLRADEQLDGGEVYVQGSTRLDPLATSMGYVGHWALYEGLSGVAVFLEDLERGEARPIETAGREDGYYSYFPYSQLRRIQKRRRQRGLKVTPTTVVFRDES
jgi:hypothetical protein